jgi:arylsulfatase A-like enzyme
LSVHLQPLLIFYSMKIKPYILLLLITATVIVTGCKSDRTEEAGSRPNIILILADDLGYSDIACYGGDIETPNLDGLAKNGVMFTHFYNTARCCPSRASLITGLHPHQTGMGSTQGVQLGVPGYIGEINENCVTIAEVLKPEGYRTYTTGKWHLTHSQDGSNKSDWPLQRGFDRFFGTIYGAGSYFDPRMLYMGNDTSTTSPDGFYYTDAISDTAVQYIEDHIKDNKEDPFFMYVAYTAPHWPLHAKPGDIEKYSGRFDAGWDELRKAKLNRMESLGLIDPDWDVETDKWDHLKWEDCTQKDWELNRMEVYAAMIDCMDQGIGRIIEQLKQENILDNTLIMFLSDNGACAEVWDPENPWAQRYGPRITRDGKILDYSNDGSRMSGPPDTYFSYGLNWSRYSNTPFLGHKQSSWEGGISTPFIVHWPEKVKPDRVPRKQVAGIIDIMPTVTSVSGAAYPESINGKIIYPMQGLNLLPAILKNEDIERDYYYMEHIGNGMILGADHWKLVRPRGQPSELYDNFTDRVETQDRASDFPEKLDLLEKEWAGWARENNVISMDSIAALRALQINTTQ